jgi:general secretion pathway protein H
MDAGRRRAFTLLELLLVVVLLGVLAAFAWPQFTGVERAEHLGESARRMQALIAMCRAEGMNEARAYRILILADGSLRVECQSDPLKPEDYAAPRVDWARTTVLLDDVWIEAVQVLPEGPPPIRIVDEKLEFPQAEYDLVPVTEFEQPVAIEFEPGGASNSLRWVLRDERGRGALLTLDGRLGRVMVADWDVLNPGEVRRPEPLAEAKSGEGKR